jgi:hypothetical protein
MNLCKVSENVTHFALRDAPMLAPLPVTDHQRSHGPLLVPEVSVASFFCTGF